MKGFYKGSIRGLGSTISENDPCALFLLRFRFRGWDFGLACYITLHAGCIRNVSARVFEVVSRRQCIIVRIEFEDTHGSLEDSVNLKSTLGLTGLSNEGNGYGTYAYKNYIILTPIKVPTVLRTGPMILQLRKLPRTDPR